MDDEDENIELEVRLARTYCKYRAKAVGIRTHRLKELDRKHIRKAVEVCVRLGITPEKFVELSFDLFPNAAGPLVSQLWGPNPVARLERYLAPKTRVLRKKTPEGAVVEKVVGEDAFRLFTALAGALANASSHGSVDVLDLVGCPADVIAFCKFQANMLDETEAAKARAVLQADPEKVLAYRELEHQSFLAKLGLQ